MNPKRFPGLSEHFWNRCYPRIRTCALGGLAVFIAVQLFSLPFGRAYPRLSCTILASVAPLFFVARKFADPDDYTLGESFWRMAVIYAVTAGIAFGSGKLLTALTGIDFLVVVVVITAAVPPLVPRLIMVLVRKTTYAPMYREFEQFEESVRKVGRFREWEVVRERIQNEGGTVIIEITEGMLCWRQFRFWWTPDRIREIAEDEPPMDKWECKIRESPFVDWIFRRYINAEDGSAILTSYEYQSEWCGAWPDPFTPLVVQPANTCAMVNPVPLRALLPGVELVVAPRVSHHCESCGYDLRATTGRCPECGQLSI